MRQRLQEHDPNARHLVHRGERSLESVVERLILRVSNRQIPHNLEALAEIGVPQLVASRQGFESSLVDNGALPERRVAPGD